MKKKTLLAVALLLVALSVAAQEQEKKSFWKEVDFSGFVLSQLAFDMNQDADGFGTTFRHIRTYGYGTVVYKEKFAFTGLLLVSDPKRINIVQEAYLDYRWRPELGAMLGIKRLPMSFANQISFSTWEALAYPIAVSNIIGGVEDLKNNCSVGRDLGFELYGSAFPSSQGFRYLTYYLGVYNGTGSNYLADTNKAKDFTGKVIVSPIKGLSLTGYAQTGLVIDGREDSRRTMWGAGAEYINSRLTLRGEYLGSSQTPVDKVGGYLLGQYLIRPNFGLVGMVENYQESASALENNINRFTFGINWFFYKRCRMQAQYMGTDRRGFSEGNGFSHMIRTQLQFVF